MKETGIVRVVDDLGRLCLPKEMRRTLHINAGDPVEFCLEDNSIIVRRYDASVDLQKLLEHVEHSIQLSDALISAKKMARLLAKVNEMKAIVREVEKQ